MTFAPPAPSSNITTGTFAHHASEFSLDDTLASGQCFRWKRRPDGWWIGVIGRQLVGIRQDGESFSWWSLPGNDAEERLRDYFQLSVDQAEIVRRITEADPAAGIAARRWSGLRLLRQDPQECIFSFVCSTANSVPRIAHSIAEFSKGWGDQLCEWEGQIYYAFPSAATLADADPQYLKQMSSLGFRAANLVRVATQIKEKGEGWAESLRKMPYWEAHRQLTSIHGIGAKIADCVCLFSLDKTEAVPVDTHVWQLAKTLYFPDWQDRKSVTEASYRAVVKAFHDRFGELAGYAQNFLFYDHFSNHWGGTSPLLKASKVQSYETPDTAI